MKTFKEYLKESQNLPAIVQSLDKINWNGAENWEQLSQMIKQANQFLQSVYDLTDEFLQNSDDFEQCKIIRKLVKDLKLTSAKFGMAYHYMGSASGKVPHLFQQDKLALAKNVVASSKLVKQIRYELEK